MLLVATMRFDQLKLQFNQQTKNKSAKRKVVPAINMVTFWTNIGFKYDKIVMQPIKIEIQPIKTNGSLVGG